MIGEGDSLGVKVSDKEVKKQFETIKSQQFPKAAEFEKFLATSGQTVSDLLLRVKLNLLSTKIQQKIVKSKGTPTEAQIAKYYNENKSRFGTPEKRNLRIILTKTEAQAASAKKEIESGKSFASVAKKVSIDPTSKANGGLLSGVVKGQEEKALDEADLRRQEGRAQRSRQDAVRLLRLRGAELTRRQPAEPGAGQGLDQAAADCHPAADGAEQVRKRIQKEVDSQNGMPHGLRGAGLQELQSAEDIHCSSAPQTARRRRAPRRRRPKYPSRRPKNRVASRSCRVGDGGVLR